LFFESGIGGKEEVTKKYHKGLREVQRKTEKVILKTPKE